ncbi:hypothetical protein ACU4GD_17585 [Cupriavidus basilensis]
MAQSRPAAQDTTATLPAADRHRRHRSAGRSAAGLCGAARWRAAAASGCWATRA